MEISRLALTLCWPMSSRKRRGRRDSSTVASSWTGIGERSRSSIECASLLAAPAARCLRRCRVVGCLRATARVVGGNRLYDVAELDGHYPLDPNAHKEQSGEQHEETGEKGEWFEARSPRCPSRSSQSPGPWQGAERL